MYTILNKTSCLEYVKNSNFFEDTSQLICEEIGDGNVNLVFRVINTIENKSIIIKQALPYLKIVGDSWPLTISRNTLEYNSMKIHEEHCIEFVPKVYCNDEDNAIFIMEDCGDMMVLRKALMDMKVFPKLADQLGIYLARNLFYTSDFGSDTSLKRIRTSKAINPELCAITEKLVFTEPYYNSSTNDINNMIIDLVEEIWSRKDVLLEVDKLRYIFMNKAEALIHGDLHTGSIFVTENKCKIFDNEFSFYGPISYDIGLLFANLILNYAYWERVIEKDVEKVNYYRKYLTKTIEGIWNRFFKEFLNLNYNKTEKRILNLDDFIYYYLKETLQEALGFCSCEIMRRVIGLAHVSELECIKDNKEKSKIERKSINIAVDVLMNRKYVDDIY